MKIDLKKNKMKLVFNEVIDGIRKIRCGLVFKNDIDLKLYRNIRSRFLDMEQQIREIVETTDLAIWGVYFVGNDRGRKKVE